MKITLTNIVGSALLLTTFASHSAQVNLINPSFEEDFSGWTEIDPTAVSGVAFDGAKSAKFSGTGARLEQTITVAKNTEYTLSAYVLKTANIGVTVGNDTFSKATSNSDWAQVNVTFNSGDHSQVTIFGEYDGAEGRVDLFQLSSSDIIAPPITSLPTFDLDPALPPSGNFDLSDWKLDLPVDENGSISGKALEVKEKELSSGYENTEFFYTGDDGGLVFISPVEGAKTSTNTKYTRSEMREMLRRGDTSVSTKGISKNNWVFSSAPSSEQDNSGGVDGVLEATLAVNAVSSTGDTSQIGRIIIGQIHANNDEPIRLYYRLLPGHSKGSLYFAHEPNADASPDDEQFINLIGSSADDASEPSDGIALNELFFYRIEVQGNQLIVTIQRDDHEDVTETVDMSTSGYDVGGQYMYFKAGVYNQNNSGDPTDYVQATFYYLTNSHEGYEFP
ncbi:polysaccharide lyase family 7 protein [Vibrio sp. MMG022]|uniref:polysaccharide lyase family 7 protein n=1 Tax=Vibrio sp. MMG023 TaxID=2909979 RepID=UPI001F2F1DE7|nr:polysaccharide lyase family 7 protein [Vibrio sp. MMG023]MCF6452312.1 polysaccharide lyase family 7 protein [Vibrio sp. MMG023]